MPQKISFSKDFVSPQFDTYIPTLLDSADITEALQLLYFGNIDTNDYDEVNSIYGNLISISGSVSSNYQDLLDHEALSASVHGLSASGGAVVGTQEIQTLTNKRLNSPKINEDVVLTATATELNYVDGVTSSVQTQLNNKPNIKVSGSDASGRTIFVQSATPTANAVGDIWLQVTGL